MAKIENTNTTKYYQDLNKGALSCMTAGNKNWYNHLGKVLIYKNRCSYNQTNALLRNILNTIANIFVS